MTPDERVRALNAATADLTWLVTIPHTLDQIIGIYAEHIGAAGRPMRHGLTNDEILASISRATESRGQKGGHSDPTPVAALYGYADSGEDDETLGSIDACVDLLWLHSAELAGVADPPMAPRRLSKLNVTVSFLHRFQSASDAGDSPDDGHTAWLVRQVADNAAWLHDKAQGIWEASKGERHTPAVQRTIVACNRCGPWRTGTIAGTGGLCEQCRTFQQHHKCLPTEAIVRAWAYSNTTRPSLILEAKAQAKPGRKAKTG